MHRMTGLAAAIAAAVTLGIGIGWMLSPKEQSRQRRRPRSPNANWSPGRWRRVRTPQRPFSPRPPSRNPHAAGRAGTASQADPRDDGARASQGAAAGARCENPDALGISRTVEIDTTGGPGFGADQFKAHDFLEPGEIVLTFDDGPWPGNTPAVLAALAAQCLKATFFPIGQHVSWHPDILRQVVAKDHTIGSHSWSHVNLAKKSLPEAKDEIENGVSAVAITAGRPLAPFFRFRG